jgi:hypothetical protein
MRRPVAALALGGMVLALLGAEASAQAAHHRRRRVLRPAAAVVPDAPAAVVPDAPAAVALTEAPPAEPVVIEEAPAPPPPPLTAPWGTPANPLVFDDGGQTPRGYLAIPSTHTALRVSGYLKLDAIHDTGPYTGDASDLPNMVLRGDPASDQRAGLTRLHARESRLSLGTFTDTSAGPVVAFLEVDFFGAGGANTYSLRMRHAYLSWKWLLAGHTFSNFLDVEARGTTIEFNGPTAAGNRKRAQIRLGHPLAAGLFFALAFENGAADYTDRDGTRVTAADSLLALDSNVVQQLPDLTAHLRYQSGASHLSLRGMARQLRVLADAGSGPPLVRAGYALAVSGCWRPHARSNLFAQATGGRALGGYVDDLDGQAATFDRTGQRLEPLLGYAALAGGEALLSDRWRGNLIASLSGVQLPALTPTGPGVQPISRRFVQLFANVIYAPTPSLLIGLEYGYYRRDTNTPLSGWSHRLQLGILYQFGA